MHEDQRMAPVELGHDRVEAWIPKVGPVGVRALQDQTVDAEDVEGTSKLVERAVHVGQWQAGEVPETPRRVGDHPGPVVVACSGQPASVPSSPKWTPVADTDSTALSMPTRSMTPREMPGLHSGSSRPATSVTALSPSSSRSGGGRR